MGRQFQIVLNEDKILCSFNAHLSVGSIRSRITIQSLKASRYFQSPSVLMPAFKLTLGNNGKLSSDTYNFIVQKKKLIYCTRKKTSILSIKYKDQNKVIFFLIK